MSASAETKDPSGGTTGRVKLYGRLGWMGARAEYSLDGEGLPLPPVLCRGRVVARSKDQAIFLALSVFWAELLRRRPRRFGDGRLVGRMRRLAGSKPCSLEYLPVQRSARPLHPPTRTIIDHETSILRCQGSAAYGYCAATARLM